MPVSHSSRIALAAILTLLVPTAGRANCPDCQDEKCAFGKCVCIPKVGCKVSIPIPGVTPGDSASPIRLPGPIQEEVNKLGKDASHTAEKLGSDTLTIFQKAGGDTIRTLQKAGGDTFATLQKAGDDSIKTTYRAAGDTTATYIKAWRDVGAQSKRSFNDAIDAGKAAAHYVENQNKAQVNAARNAEKRLREGKIIDSMWGVATEPLRSSEQNFAKATQESEVINTAAGTAAAVYGGPAGAAAYAAWSTYRRTGDADMALRAGVLAAVTSQMGSSVAKMPAGTTSEIIKKAAVAGAAGGISVAAAGGDEQAIKDGFLKSAGAVLIQGASDKLEAYSPEAKDAYDTVHCISARDVDCLSNTTWARDAKGKILYDKDGNPRFDTNKFDPRDYACIAARDVDCLANTTWARDARGKILYDKDGNPRFDTSKLDTKEYTCISARDVDCLANTTWARDARGKVLYDKDGNPRLDTGKFDPKQYTGKWTAIDAQSAEGKTNTYITEVSKLPKTEAIPILKNQWVLTWTLGKDQDITYKTPTVVLTYVGKDPPFYSNVTYGSSVTKPSVGQKEVGIVVAALRFSPDGSALAVRWSLSEDSRPNRDTIVQVLPLRSSAPTLTATASHTACPNLVWTPDSAAIAYFSRSRLIGHDTRSGSTTEFKDEFIHCGMGWNELGYTPDYSEMFVGSDSGDILIAEREGPGALYRFTSTAGKPSFSDRIWRVPQLGAGYLSASFSSDGRYLAVALGRRRWDEADQLLRVYDTNAKTKIFERSLGKLGDYLGPRVALSGNGRRMVMIGNIWSGDQQPLLFEAFEVAGNRPLLKVEIPDELNTWHQSLAITHDGSIAVYGSAGPSLSMRRLSDGKPYTVPVQTTDPPDNGGYYRQYTISRDGSLVAMATSGGRIHLVDIKSSKIVKEIDAQETLRGVEQALMKRTCAAALTPCRLGPIP